MDKKHMKKCSISLATWKMQIRTSMRYYFTLTRMAIMKNTDNNKW